MKPTDPGYQDKLRKFLSAGCHVIAETNYTYRDALLIGMWNSGSEGHCEQRCKYRSVDYYCEHPEHPRNIPLEDVVVEEL